jgi:hypothetical protein
MIILRHTIAKVAGFEVGVTFGGQLESSVTNPEKNNLNFCLGDCHEYLRSSSWSHKLWKTTFTYARLDVCLHSKPNR